MENELLDGHNLDLPLSANFHEIEVVHFILDLSCSLENKSFQGALTIFCRISNSKEKLKENKRKLYEAESCESLLKIECQNCQQCYHKVPMHMTESEFTELHPHEVLKDNLTSSSSAGQNEHIKTNEEICFCKDKTNAHFLNDSIRCSEIILDCSTIDVEHCILYDTSNITSEISVDEIKGMIKPMNMVMECFCKNTSLPETSYLHISQCCMEKYLKYYTFLKALTTENLMDLKFKVSDHSLTIYLPEEVRDKSEHVIKINFMTRPEGPSLMWTLDQTNMPCVFTIGHQLNNRSLFPSQDMPQAMSTWHCFITLGKVENEKTTVLMTGEAPANIIQNEDEIVYQFSNSYPMPASTFALAVGCWKFTDLSSVIQANEHPIGSSFQAPTCHLFSPSNLEPHTTDLMSRYLPMCFRSLDIVLGPYPLKHLNILIVPDCFDSLGMASPHLILLSQSVLCPDMSMLLRLAHELCHTWFGILTGPRDWTEEWLTEGVCCYLEDIIHGMIMDWDEDRLNLRALIKYKLLASEITNTSEHLQTLRPNEGVDDTPGSSDKKVFVKNGLDPEKTLNQVHYLKGYFLLLNLQQVAGKELFLDTVKTFINDHLGRLFSSQEFLIYIFDHCASLGLSGLTVDRVCMEWLDCPGMPTSFPSLRSNKLVTQVDTLISEIKAMSSRKRVRGQSSTPARSQLKKILSTELTTEQRILFLDLVVEEGISLSSRQLRDMREMWRIPETNAEVQHGWCEMVIHCQAVQWSDDVRNFLVNHQALGVYLYGELMISEHPRLQQLAHECYSRTQLFMPEGPKSVVRAMLFPECSGSQAVVQDQIVQREIHSSDIPL